MDERTPLITTVRLRPVRRRYPHNVCRRFCTIALSSVLIATIISFVFTSFFDADYRYGPDHPWLSSLRGNVTEAELREMLIGIPSSKKAAQWSKHYTSGPHLAGTNRSLAEWTADKWEEFGIKSDIVAYDVYLNYPIDHRLALLKGSGGDSSITNWEVSYEAALAEDILEDDPTSGLEDRIPTFHGYSANGNVTAPYVYVNYGTYQDFHDLVDANITLEGKIAVARYGLIFRGLKIKRAQELGMVGVVIFTDPGDDGEVTAEHGYEAYPDGPARQPSSVQRGSAQFLSIAPGDPTTPGYPSKPGVPRHSTDHVIAKIPSVPMSYEDVLPILKALNGHGPKSSDFSKFWTANEGLGYKGVDYNIGPSPDNLRLNLFNEQEYVTTPLWNVIGVINGSIPDEVIVVGNHRDAWIAGGAGDPNSGSSVMMEVVRSFGEAIKAGWKPLRTIVFASWDGEEYALIGSTEWVEEYLPWLNEANVAYVNVDVGVSGTEFNAAAAPLLDDILRDATAQIQSPNQTVKGQTVADVWDGHIRTMGSGSDFTAFQDFAGVPCIDMGFKFSPTTAVYHYHSNYDSFHWMETYGDPGFKYHKTMAQILGVVTATLADKPLIPLNATAYAKALNKYAGTIEKKLDPHHSKSVDAMYLADLPDEELFHLRASTVDLKREQRGTIDELRDAVFELAIKITEFEEAAEKLDERSKRLGQKLEVHIPWWKFWEWVRMIFSIRKTNGQYKMLERHFLHPEGLDGREWYKHVIFAPGLWTGYAGATYPGLVESIDFKDYVNGVKWAKIIKECVENARKSIS
ncbi:hypothetical protein MKZ38_001779 [Zalerion maritima]|uniref:Uncharacterized protein n=1 Tax=Zalerion maritima TaxID=339359 RepID=A0AAD5WVI0_9PEZI|nr:hypothetical protein MKZ38_001779 [Zalerion maritima]